MTLFTCMHPHAGREKVGGWEVCGSCGETREISAQLWKASQRVQMRVGGEWWTLTADERVVCIRRSM